MRRHTKKPSIWHRIGSLTEKNGINEVRIWRRDRVHHVPRWPKFQSPAAAASTYTYKKHGDGCSGMNACCGSEHLKTQKTVSNTTRMRSTDYMCSVTVLCRKIMTTNLLSRGSHRLLTGSRSESRVASRCRRCVSTVSLVGLTATCSIQRPQSRTTDCYCTGSSDGQMRERAWFRQTVPERTGFCLSLTEVLNSKLQGNRKRRSSW